MLRTLIGKWYTLNFHRLFIALLNKIMLNIKNNYDVILYNGAKIYYFFILPTLSRIASGFHLYIKAGLKIF